MTTETFSLEGRSVRVTGHRGLLGSAVVRRLERKPVDSIIGAASDTADLPRQDRNEDFVSSTKPDVLVVATARVGGIHAIARRKEQTRGTSGEQPKT